MVSEIITMILICSKENEAATDATPLLLKHSGTQGIYTPEHPKNNLSYRQTYLKTS